jgi:CheY-like chemotaxis protein
MAQILVVEDSPSQALQIQLLLQDAGFDVETAPGGREALAAIKRHAPDVVLTDLQMPGMNGLELVEAVRREHPVLPVILMTQHGSEEIAVEALKKGAASYVPKRNLRQEISTVVDEVLAATSADRYQKQVLGCLTRTESHYVLDNDTALISPLISYLQRNLTALGLCDETDLIRVGVALREALINAMHHGNLEVSSEIFRQDEEAYYNLVRERAGQSPYRERRVRLLARESRAEAVFVIADEGPGFNPALLPDPTDPANLEKPTGRGLLLIRSFMDEVTFNDRGNEITLVKRCGP